MEQLYKDTVRKVKYLRECGFEVEQKWGCELAKEMEENEEMKRFFEEYELVDPLQPRDAFYGGRTNAAKLLHECRDGEEIRYVLEYTAELPFYILTLLFTGTYDSRMLRVTNLLPFFTGMWILRVYIRGAIKLRTMSLAILKLSLRILTTFLPTLD